MSRSQTATEYLIILGVVVFISVIVVSSLSNIIQLGDNEYSKTKLEWKVQSPLAVTNWISDNTGIKIILQNTGENIVRLKDISLNNFTINFFRNIPSGGFEEISFLGRPDEMYEYPLSFTYLSENSEYTLNSSYLQGGTLPPILGKKGSGYTVVIDYFGSDLLRYYNFNEDTTSVMYDSSDYGVDEIHNSGSFVEGIEGNAVSLSIDDLNISTPFTNYDNLSVSFWLYPTSVPPGGSNRAFLYSGDPFDAYGNPNSYKLAFRWYTGGNIRFDFTNSSLTRFVGETNLPLNNWYFLTATYNTSHVAGYVDGVRVGQATMSGNLSLDEYFQGSYFGYGRMDQLMFFDRALTSEEISKLYSFFS